MLAAKLTVQLDVTQRNYFWLADQHSKLVEPLFVYCRHINPTMSQQILQTDNDGTNICVTWAEIDTDENV